MRDGDRRIIVRRSVDLAAGDTVRHLENPPGEWVTLARVEPYRNEHAGGVRVYPFVGAYTCIGEDEVLEVREVESDGQD